MTRLPPDERPTAEELRGGGGMNCPGCGCGHLKAYRTSDLPTGSIRRYRECRNCGKKFVTSTPPEKIVREVESKPDEDDERPALKVRIA